MNSKDKKASGNDLFDTLVEYYQQKEIVPTAEMENRLWARICAKSAEQKRKQRILRISLWLGSAVAAIFIGLVFFLSYSNPTEDSLMAYVKKYGVEKQQTTSEHILLYCGENQWALELDDYSFVQYNHLGERTCSSNQVANLSKLLADGNTPNGNTSIDRIIVPKGKYIRIVLSDGTIMHMNESTMAAFPAKFEAEQREIYVAGEAYLEVMPYKESPFIVKTSQFDVRVLGTSFDVNTYNNQMGKVTLVHGKVELFAENKEKLQLNPNEQASIYKNGLMQKKTVDADEIISWTERKLTLDNMTFGEVVEYLEQYYNVSIAITSEQSEIQFHGNLYLDKDIESVLQNISFISSVKFEKLGKNNYLVN